MTISLSVQAAVILGVILLASLAINGLLIYYTRISLVKFASVSEGIGSLKDSITAFAVHLKYVYELEMYYGDETLQALIDHARDLSASFDEYEEFYDLFDLPVQDDVEEMEEPEDGTQTQE